MGSSLNNSHGMTPIPSTPPRPMEDMVTRLQDPPQRSLDEDNSSEKDDDNDGASDVRRRRNSDDMAGSDDANCDENPPQKFSSISRRKLSVWKQKLMEEQPSKSDVEIQKVPGDDIVFDASGNTYYYWMALVTIAVFYNCAVIIMKICFSEMRIVSLFNQLDFLCDVIYTVDICVHFRTGYLEHGVPVTDPVKLSANYKGKPEFKWDIASLIPLTSIVQIVCAFLSLLLGDSVDITSTDVYVPVIIPLTRLPRIFKYHRMTKFFDATDARTKNPNVSRALKLSLYLWMVIHWIGCAYYFVSAYEGLGINDWVYPNSTGSDRFFRKYILCSYWSTMTLTTIGERPPPETDIEYVFTGITFLIGVFVFAAVVGNVGDVISNLNAARQDFQARMDQIKLYMNERSVPDHLQNRVKSWADYSWSRNQARDEPNLLEMLPERLRSEIAVCVHLDTLKKVRIFDSCEEGLLHELVLKLRAQIYSPKDYICRIGEIGREMYIINHGIVEILVPSSMTAEPTVVAKLTKGNYFGEISLLRLDSGQNRRTADVRSVGYSELLCLSRKDLMTALVEYPDAKKILEDHALQRMKETREVRHTSAEKAPTSLFAEAAAKAVAAQRSSSSTEPGRSKHRLASIIKSDMFQRLVAARGQEMTEMKQLINELKSFDSQATKLRIQQLTEKCDDLQRELKRRNDELQSAVQRVADLELSILKPGNKNCHKDVQHATVSPSSFHNLIQNGHCNNRETEIHKKENRNSEERKKLRHLRKRNHQEPEKRHWNFQSSQRSVSDWPSLNREHNILHSLSVPNGVIESKSDNDCAYNKNTNISEGSKRRVRSISAPAIHINGQPYESATDIAINTLSVPNVLLDDVMADQLEGADIMQQFLDVCQDETSTSSHQSDNGSSETSGDDSDDEDDDDEDEDYDYSET